MYEEEHIKSLHTYLKECIEDERKKKDALPDAVNGINRLLDLQRAIEAIRFNPLLFNDMFERYDLGDILTYPLEDLPLHLNDVGLLSQVLVEWRCSNNI